MPTTLRWDGLPAFNREILSNIDEARDAAHEIVERGLHKMEERIKIRAREGGRHSRGTPTPAVHGAGPAAILGNLGRSIRVSPIAAMGVAGFEGEVGPTMIYARAVELKYDYPYTRPGAQDSISWVRWYAGQRWARVSGGGSSTAGGGL